MWILLLSFVGVSFSSTTARSISTSELLHRKLYDVAAHPKHPELKIASAQGIFLKAPDRDVWTPLAQFDAKDYPVLISPKGDLFVGTQRSRDQGKNFSQFIAWDEVLSQVVAVTQRTHDHVKVVGIKWQEPDRLKILIDVGSSQYVEVSLATKDLP